MPGMRRQGTAFGSWGLKHEEGRRGGGQLSIAYFPSGRRLRAAGGGDLEDALFSAVRGQHAESMCELLLSPGGAGPGA